MPEAWRLRRENGQFQFARGAFTWRALNQKPLLVDDLIWECSRGHIKGTEFESEWDRLVLDMDAYRKSCAAIWAEAQQYAERETGLQMLTKADVTEMGIREGHIKVQSGGAVTVATCPELRHPGLREAFVDTAYQPGVLWALKNCFPGKVLKELYDPERCVNVDGHELYNRNKDESLGVPLAFGSFEQMNNCAKAHRNLVEEVKAKALTTLVPHDNRLRQQLQGISKQLKLWIAMRRFPGDCAICTTRKGSGPGA